jgi:hypothetical protein
MSGSLTWFQYTTDGGVNYAIQADKSNVIAVNPSGATAPANLPTGAVPRNIRPRYALFADASGLIRRKVVLLNDTDVAALKPTTTFTPQGETVLVKLTYYSGEKIRLPKLVDTGRTT